MFARPAWLALMRTEAAGWIVPARVLLGAYFLLHLGGDLCGQLAICRGGARFDDIAPHHASRQGCVTAFDRVSLSLREAAQAP